MLVWGYVCLVAVHLLPTCQYAGQYSRLIGGVQQCSGVMVPGMLQVRLYVRRALLLCQDKDVRLLSGMNFLLLRTGLQSAWDQDYRSQGDCPFLGSLGVHSETFVGFLANNSRAAVSVLEACSAKALRSGLMPQQSPVSSSEAGYCSCENDLLVRRRPPSTLATPSRCASGWLSWREPWATLEPACL